MSIDTDPRVRVLERQMRAAVDTRDWVAVESCGRAVAWAAILAALRQGAGSVRRWVQGAGTSLGARVGAARSRP